MCIILDCNTYERRFFTMRISYYRRKAGLTQENLARMLNISLNHYYRIEKEKALPNVIVGLKMSIILKVDPFVLWEITEY